MSRSCPDSGRDELAQKACLLEGLTQLLSLTPGNFAVLMHSDPDCANLVLRDSRALDPTRFFCTNLRERDLLGRSSRERLREALHEVARAKRPRAIFVLGSCVASLIAEDLEELVRAEQAALDVPVIPLPVEALRRHGQAEIIDRYTSLMAGLVRPRARRKRCSVNLLGFLPDQGEAAELLGRLGIAVNGAPQLGAPAGEWADLTRGALNVVADARLFSRLLRELEERHDLPSLDGVPLPVGLAASEAFYRQVAARHGREAQVERKLAPELERARRALRRARQRFGGRRLAYHVGSRRDFELSTVLQEGLLFVAPLAELGFEVEVLFQGATEERSRRRAARLLERLGLDLRFQLLRDRLSLTGALREGAYDAIYCSDSLGPEVRAAGVPLLAHGTLRPGLRGVEANLGLIRAALDREPVG